MMHASWRSPDEVTRNDKHGSGPQCVYKIHNVLSVSDGVSNDTKVVASQQVVANRLSAHALTDPNAQSTE